MADDVPVIELHVTIDGQEALGLFGGDMVLAPGLAERDLVLAALSEALMVVCGQRPRSGSEPSISIHRTTPAPILKLVRD